ncbi:hypothetical protein [Comamonas sp.]|uniref:hypothetical protein n=1 Tax=Comamonas sp. TaxID=34028 RepID=UPI002899C75E|nr:hypothetical protein [Comamonas sp.]
MTHPLLVSVLMSLKASVNACACALWCIATEANAATTPTHKEWFIAISYTFIRFLQILTFKCAMQARRCQSLKVVIVITLAPSRKTREILYIYTVIVGHLFWLAEEIGDAAH